MLKTSRYSVEKILIKRRIPKGKKIKGKRTDIEISIYKLFHFLQFHPSFCFDYRNHRYLY